MERAFVDSRDLPEFPANFQCTSCVLHGNRQQLMHQIVGIGFCFRRSFTEYAPRCCASARIVVAGRRRRGRPSRC